MSVKLRWIVASALLTVLAATAIYQNITHKKNNMTAVQFTTIEQKQMSFAAGKVTVVNFWATSCTTCKKEMPRMVQMYQKFNPQGLEYVGIAMQYDNPMYVQNYVKANQLPFNVAWDNDGRLSRQFGDIMGTPTTFIIDKQGQIVYQVVGEPQWDEFEHTVKKALES